MSRNPDRTARRLAFAAGALLVAGFIVFAIRGDFFRASGMDADDSGCGYEMVC